MTGRTKGKIFTLPNCSTRFCRPFDQVTGRRNAPAFQGNQSRRREKLCSPQSTAPSASTLMRENLSDRIAQDQQCRISPEAADREVRQFFLYVQFQPLRVLAKARERCNAGHGDLLEMRDPPPGGTGLSSPENRLDPAIGIAGDADNTAVNETKNLVVDPLKDAGRHIHLSGRDLSLHCLTFPTRSIPSVAHRRKQVSRFIPLRPVSSFERLD